MPVISAMFVHQLLWHFTEVCAPFSPSRFSRSNGCPAAVLVAALQRTAELEYCLSVL
jgi:hypothetical protein